MIYWSGTQGGRMTPWGLGPLGSPPVGTVQPWHPRHPSLRPPGNDGRRAWESCLTTWREGRGDLPQFWSQLSLLSVASYTPFPHPDLKLLPYDGSAWGSS